MNNLINIFVYGTLRPPRPGTRPDDSRFYSEIAPYVVSATPARVEGAVLHEHGAYPCARPGTGTVHGEVLQVKPEALAIADRIEGHPHLFERQRVAVQTDAGTEEAWLYWASPELIEGCPRITSPSVTGTSRRCTSGGRGDRWPRPVPRLSPPSSTIPVTTTRRSALNCRT
jgi:gamma-glutamylcyclotransferase (GGCT)/AIG2-like uncharacterized protein YtfP